MKHQVERMKVQQVAKLTGVSVRTLHYYDEIGLLAPGEVTEAGYRLYGEAELEKLQQILFYRELDFPLLQIKDLLSRPDYNREEALRGQRELLTLKRDRLNKLISLLERTLKGEIRMNFEEFDSSELQRAREEYAQEAQRRYGDTDAYKVSKERADNYQQEDWARIQGEIKSCYDAFICAMAHGPASEEAAQAVKGWRDCITQNFYPCTDEILTGLGEMYVGDSRFTENLNREQEGLAQFMSESMAAYAQRNDQQ